MKFKVLIVVLLVAVAWVAGRQMSVETSTTETKGTTEAAGHEEIRKAFQLEAGATVEVKGINGSVEVETAEGDAAEVHIVRTAERESDLHHHRITVEQSASSLTISGGKGDDASWWKFWRSGGVREQVRLKLPRAVELTTKGINGPVRVGELDGGINAKGINGRVEVAQATGFAEVSGVNGGVLVRIARLGERGISVKGINGGVELHIPSDANADLNIKGLNGGMSVNLSNMTEQERTHNNLRATLGTGGAEISLTGINGSVRLETAPGAGTN